VLFFRRVVGVPSCDGGGVGIVVVVFIIFNVVYDCLFHIFSLIYPWLVLYELLVVLQTLVIFGILTACCL